MKSLKYICCVLVVLLLFIAVIVMSEGVRGFNVFMNLESLILVIGGTLLVVLSTFSWSEIGTSLRCALSKKYNPTPEQLERAKHFFSSLSNSVVALGCITSVFAMILMLNTIEDVREVPRRMALALTSLFYGLLLSEVIFVPLKRNVEKLDSGISKPDSQDRNRVLMGMSVFLILLTCFFTIMYSLSAAFNSKIHEQRKIESGDRIVVE